MSGLSGNLNNDVKLLDYNPLCVHSCSLSHSKKTQVFDDGNIDIKYLGSGCTASCVSIGARWRLCETSKPVRQDVSDGSNLSNSSVKYAAAINKNVDRDGNDSLSRKKCAILCCFYTQTLRKVFSNPSFSSRLDS